MEQIYGSYDPLELINNPGLAEDVAEDYEVYAWHFDYAEPSIHDTVSNHISLDTFRLALDSASGEVTKL